ncbi:MAG: hypothetical protein ACI4EV_01355, partial [Lachnospiraceae bacterium]
MDLQSVKGIGSKYAQLLNRLDVFTAEDLLELFPRGYQQFDDPVSLKKAKSVENPVALYLAITGTVKMNTVRKLSILSVEASDEE